METTAREGLEHGLTPELEMLRDTVHAFCVRHVAPRAAEIDAEDAFPRDLWPRLGELGLHGVTVDEPYGGAGLGYLAQCLVMEEISRHSASLGLSYGAHANLCMNQISLHGTDAQKRHYLPGLVDGRHVGALAMSEPDAGSDVIGMSMRAEPRDGGFVLNGRKMWITNGPHADVLVVYAKTAPGAGAHGITAFVLDTHRPGLRASSHVDKLGMRGSSTSELVFENVFVPADCVLGGLHHGVQVLMRGLDYERVVLSAGPLGILQACLDLVVPYVRERRQFGRPIGTFQLMQAKLADMYATLSACRAYVYAVARACDRGECTRKDAAACILFVSERATQTALQAIQALGGNGYTNDYAAGRLLRDAKLYEIGAGTNEVRRMLVGREIFEEDAAALRLVS